MNETSPFRFCCIGCALVAGAIIVLGLIAGSLFYPRAKTAFTGFLRAQKTWQELTASWQPPGSVADALPAVAGWKATNTSAANPPAWLGLPPPAMGRRYACDKGEADVYVWKGTPEQALSLVTSVRGAVNHLGGGKMLFAGPGFFTYRAGEHGGGTVWSKGGWAFLAVTTGETDTNAFLLSLLQSNRAPAPTAAPPSETVVLACRRPQV